MQNFPVLHFGQSSGPASSTAATAVTPHVSCWEFLFCSNLLVWITSSGIVVIVWWDKNYSLFFQSYLLHLLHVLIPPYYPTQHFRSHWILHSNLCVHVSSIVRLVSHILEFSPHFLEIIFHCLKGLAVDFCIDRGLPLLGFKSLFRNPVFIISSTIHSIVSRFGSNMLSTEF